MNIKINRNILWTEAFVKELASIGVKYACISPGSRNTPLTLAFAKNNKIKSYLHIDERSCAFFALGLAKAENTPVALVVTSGTATAELYPAIIEAYQQRVPLIVCTADRPPELLDCGANQTINQNNLYKNHIRWFFDTGLPEPIPRRIKHIKTVARRAVYESCMRSKGPVHINFPFRKPFEPESYTDEVGEDLIELSSKMLVNKEELFKEEEKNLTGEKWFKEIYNHIKESRRGLIIAGPENYNPLFHQQCQRLAEKLGYPVLADGASQLRFGEISKNNIISNFEGFLRSDKFADKYKPDLILQFGRTVTSKALDIYLEKCTTNRFMINEFGDWFDPSNKAAAAFACKPVLFCSKMIETIETDNFESKSNEWLETFLKADEISGEVKKKVIDNASFAAESRVTVEVLKAIPSGSQIMISNSMPIRDFDYFAQKSDKKITVFNNRGASGIDGIISTALGISAANGKPTVLITGDLAFYYDMNGLLASKKYEIPLTVILVNNNGGGIFEVLPISEYGEVFNDYFIAPHNLKFEPFIIGYDGDYSLIDNWDNFSEAFKKAITSKKLSVLEIKTNAKESLKKRREFWSQVDEKITEIKL